MNYDELFSLEQKAIFQHCSINEPIADLFFQIQAQDVPLAPEKSILRDLILQIVKMVNVV